MTISGDNKAKEHLEEQRLEQHPIDTLRQVVQDEHVFQRHVHQIQHMGRYAHRAIIYVQCMSGSHLVESCTEKRDGLLAQNDTHVSTEHALMVEVHDG